MSESGIEDAALERVVGKFPNSVVTIFERRRAQRKAGCGEQAREITPIKFVGENEALSPNEKTNKHTDKYSVTHNNITPGPKIIHIPTHRFVVENPHFYAFTTGGSKP